MNSARPAVLFAVLKPAFEIGESWGPAILVRALVSGLARAGSPVTLLTVRGQTVAAVEHRAGAQARSEISLRWTGNRIYRFLESGLRAVQTILHLPYLGLFDNLRFYEAALRTLPPHQVCHEYYSLFGIAALLACRRRGVPHVLLVDADLLLESELAGARLHPLQKWLAVRTARFLFRNTSRMIVVSEASKAHFVRTWGVPAEKIAILPNGVDARFFDVGSADGPARRTVGVPEDAVVVMFVGSFQPWHGLDLLLESFSQVRVECPHAVLVLVGDGPMRTEVEAEIGRRGLGRSVILAGQQPHQEIPGWLQLADIAVAPYPETSGELWFSPLKLYEYMAAGKAIVATGAGQIAQVIESGVDGLLVQPNDPQALSRALIELVRLPQLREALGRRAGQKAREQHTWDIVIENLGAIYKDVIERNEKA